MSKWHTNPVGAFSSLGLQRYIFHPGGQDVARKPYGLSDCLSVSLRDSRISGHFREGAEIRESRGACFYFLSMSGCSLVDGGQGKPVGRNFNHFKSSAFQQVVDFIFEVADSPFGSWRTVKEVLM